MHLATEEKIVKLIPEESMIGFLLNNRENYRIIKSDGSGIMQHDPFLWQIENDDFINGEKIYMSAHFFDTTFNDWVYTSAPEDREKFIEALFKMINAANFENATSFVDWSDYLKNNPSVIYELIKEFDPETRNLILKGFGNIFSTINKNVKSAPKKLWADTVKKIKEMANNEEEV